MYKDYFRLTEMPFSIAPDPRFLYMSGVHREALAHLLYGVQGQGGIVLLTGEVGTGKTTLCRCLLEQIHPRCDVAFILNPRLSVEELLAAVCDEFHVEVPANASVKVLVDVINSHLLRVHAEDRRAVLIVDEAQNLHPDVLEQLRLLTNLETNTRKLLQIILIGQPELQAMLRRPELRQVAQRIVARYHLAHLTRLEVAAYVVHRLRVSGSETPVFPYSLIGPLYRFTGGVPRLINQVCDRALLGTYVQGKLQVTPKILRKAAREVFGVSAAWELWRRFVPRSRIALAALGAGGVFAAAMVPLSAGLFSWTAAKTAATAMVQSLPLQRQSPAVLPVQEAASVSPASFSDSRAPLAEPSGWPDEAILRARSEALAFQELLKLYQLDYDPRGAEAACKVIEAVNVHCLYARGGLADLLRINQPAVLLMEGDGRNSPYYALLSALTEDSATLSVGGIKRRVALREMAADWSGSYIVVWYAPPGFNDTLAAGSRGPAVSWLRQSLARLQGGTPDGPPLFDADLGRRLKTFQLAEGFVPDGVAGALTIIRMNIRLDDRLPRLTRGAGA